MIQGYEEICNMALNRIGVSHTIANLETEQDMETKVCRAWFGPVRDRILRAYPWSFAERRVVLAEVPGAPTNWRHAYAYPSDCLNARAIVRIGIRMPRVTQRIPFQVANNGTNRVLLCDLPHAELIYTARVVDPMLFDPLFVSAYAALLGSEVCRPLSVAPANADAAMKLYVAEISNALAVAMSEGFEGPEPDSEFITVRHTALTREQAPLGMGPLDFLRGDDLG